MLQDSLRSALPMSFHLNCHRGALRHHVMNVVVETDLAKLCLDQSEPHKPAAIEHAQSGMFAKWHPLPPCRRMNVTSPLSHILKPNIEHDSRCNLMGVASCVEKQA